MHDKLRERVLVGWADLTCDHPWWVLGVAMLIAVASVVVTVQRLTFKPDRNDLLSADIPWNQTFLDWTESFEGFDDLIVVVESDDPSDGDAERFIDALAERLLVLDRVERVLSKYDTTALSPKLIRSLDDAAFDAALNDVEQARPLWGSDTPGALLGAMSRAMQAGVGGGGGGDAEDGGGVAGIVDGVERMGEVIDGFSVVIRGDSDALVLDRSARYRYLTSENGRLFFVRVTPNLEKDTLDAIGHAVDEVRGAIDGLRGDYPELSVGVTGVKALETDETRVATRDSAIGSAVAAVLLTVLLVVAFHGWQMPVLMMVSLLVGVAWSFGFTTLAVGHLQVLSITFMVILLGLGIAYGIYLTSRFEMVRHDYADDVAGFKLAMRDSFVVTGPGVATGALTTAAAFVTTVFTDLDGMAEMGIIAAGGVVLCFVAMFFVLPALMRLFHRHHDHFRELESRSIHLYRESWSMPFVRHRVATLVVAGLLTCCGIVAALGMQFDYNLTNLQPPDVESVVWQQRILERGGRSVWYAVSVADDLDDARAKAAAFEALDSVAEVGGIMAFLPRNESAKLARLDTLRESMGAVLKDGNDVGDAGGNVGGNVRENVEGAGGLLGQVRLMRSALALARGAQLPDGLAGALSNLSASIDGLIGAIEGLAESERAERLAALQRVYAEARAGVIGRTEGLFDATVFTMADLPGELASPYVDERGRVVLEIFPAVAVGVGGGDGVGDGEGGALSRKRRGEDAGGNVGGNAGENVGGGGPLDSGFLPGFVADVAGVDEDVTGPMVQVYRSSELIRRSYLQAGLYALVVVWVLVMLDLRSPWGGLVSLVPVAVGFAVTFLMLRLLGMRLNPANVIVLPLMFGIGVDAGVHVLHRARVDGSGRGKAGGNVGGKVGGAVGLTSGTGKGITVTSLTVMIGFGVLAFASHRGIASLGLVMTIGIGLTMLACWTVMPAWLSRGKGKSGH